MRNISFNVESILFPVKSAVGGRGRPALLDTFGELGLFLFS